MRVICSSFSRRPSATDHDQDGCSSVALAGLGSDSLLLNEPAGRGFPGWGLTRSNMRVQLNGRVDESAGWGPMR